MDNLNRIVSFVLGLVVVLVFFAVVTGRLSLGNRLKFPSANIFGRKVTPTPRLSVTPTPTTTSTAINIPESNDNYRPYQEPVRDTGTTTVRTIPSTGVPAIFFPAMLATSLAGIILRRTGKK